MKSQKHLLSKLFISTLYLSAFTFGGGYVIITLMKKKFVDQYHWIDDEEMLDLIAIAQSSPGAIAVNGAIVVGYKLAGIPGVLLCVLATVLPPFVIISILSVFSILTLFIMSCNSLPQADLILYNGTIYTADSAFSTCNAMAIKDGKIVATGGNDLRNNYNCKSYGKGNNVNGLFAPRYFSL